MRRVSGWESILVSTGVLDPLLLETEMSKLKKHWKRILLNRFIVAT